MEDAHAIVATPMGTLLVLSNGADELVACTLDANQKASWTDRDVAGIDAVAETITVNGRARTLRLRVVTVAQLQANAAEAAARHGGHAYQEAPRWSHGRWGLNDYGLELPGGTQAAKERVRAVLLPFFAGWATTEPGRALLHQAEDRRLNALIDRLDREALELEQQAAARRADKATARATLARHRTATVGTASSASIEAASTAGGIR
jgi:hypothetical protein